MIRRAQHQTAYAVIANGALRDKRLSFKARGLLALLLSMPDDWRVTERWLAEQGPDGRDAVRSGLSELESAGYLRRTRHRDERGHWQHRSTVYETSVAPDEEWPEEPGCDPSARNSPGLDYPTAGDPAAGNPAVEVVLSNEVPKEHSPHNPPRAESRSSGAEVIPLPGTGPSLTPEAPGEPEPSFAEFYAAYPRKVARRAAEKAWGQAVKRAAPSVILAGLVAQVPGFRLRETKFTPYPATWLNRDQWADEPDWMAERQRRRASHHAAHERARRGLSLADPADEVRELGP